MNSRAFTLSLVIALFSMAIVWSYLDAQKKEFIKHYGNEETVVVANQDIPQFEIINDRNVTTISVPSKFKAPGSFTKIEDLQNMIALVPVLEGEQITKPRVSHPDGSTGLARQVSQNKRAISIRVSDDQAVSKLIKPGDRVDVLARIDYGGGRKDLQKIKTMLQDVLVLSTGLSITNSLPLVGTVQNNKIRQLNLSTYTNYTTVTLELDPYQAQKILFQIDVLGAKPYLTLRNNNDKEQVRIKATRLYDILDTDTAEAQNFFKRQQQNTGGPGGR